MIFIARQAFQFFLNQLCCSVARWKLVSTRFWIHASGKSQRKAVERKPGSSLPAMALSYQKEAYFQPWYGFHPAAVLCNVQTFLGECRTPVEGGRRILHLLGKDMASHCPQSCDFCCISQMKRPAPRPVHFPWSSQTCLEWSAGKRRRAPVGQEKVAASFEHN